MLRDRKDLAVPRVIPRKELAVSTIIPSLMPRLQDFGLILQ